MLNHTLPIHEAKESDGSVGRHSVAILLDSAPQTWTSQEDRHLRLCQALVSRRVTPVLVFAQPLCPGMDHKFRASGAEVETINYSQGHGSYYWQLSHLVRKHRIDTAHVIFFDYFSPIHWIARLAGIRYILYEMQNSGVFRARSWKRLLQQLRTRLMTIPVTHVIAISEFVKHQLIAGGFDEGKITVRYLGVDTNRFVPDAAARQQWSEQFDIAKDEVILSTVSYLRPFKNPQVIVHACGHLLERGIPFRLFVAGGGEMLEELKQLSARLGLTRRIHWLGNVADPTSLLQASDIFLLASVGEAFGLVLAEAMACGVPVVGTRSGSLPEVVEDGRTGLLAPALDVASFADAVERLAVNKELRRAMGMQALERVRETFALQRAVAARMEVYESLWSDSSSSASGNRRDLND
jgi:glycosyltransferase involved in cell wall biosynthesis